MSISTVPVATHARIETDGLAETASIRHLEFFYGVSRPLKGITLSLYAIQNALLRRSGVGLR